MVFSYKDYAKRGMDYPCNFNKYKSVDSVLLKDLEKDFYKDGDPVKRTFDELKLRTTRDYYDKVESVQVKALEYARSVFPTYKFIMPDALADDWLSTVDWHKKYPSRDHSLHQTLTAYIVNRLLGGGNSQYALKLNRLSDNNLLDYCASRILCSSGTRYLVEFYKELNPDFEQQPDSFKRRWAKDVFYETAMVAALFHDMGYPWQYINNLKKAIKVADNGMETDVVGNARSTLEAIRYRLLVYPFFGYSTSNLRHPTPIMIDNALRLIDSGLKSTHGMPGALGFLALNDRIRDINNTRSREDANYRLVLEWAAVGIMMHDMAKIYWNEKEEKPRNPILRLSFEVDPLSCIISLADILEEFYRPSAHFEKCTHDVNGEKKEFVNLSYGFPCVGSGIEIVGRHLNVTYFYEEQTKANQELKRRQDEVIQYLNPANGYIDISPLGVTEVNCYAKDKTDIEIGL